MLPAIRSHGRPQALFAFSAGVSGVFTNAAVRFLSIS
jgi:hypothetical protein